MTVAELTPIELYCIVIAAILTVGMILLGIREYPKLTTKREKFVLFAGVGAAYGLPMLIAFRALAP